MDAWLLWLIAAVILAVGEIATMGLYLAPFAAGALVAALAGAAGAGTAINLIIFLVISIVALAALRPLARSQRRMPPQIRTGTAALVGRKATVLERIANHEGVGCVRLDGEVWTARAYDEDEVIEEGRRVHVMEIRGATAPVSEEEEQTVMSAGIIALIVLAFFVFVVAASGIRIVPQARAGVVERLGRYAKTLDPGLALIIPSVAGLKPLIDLREQVVSFPPQPVITEDNLVVGIDTVIYFTVTDP